jgi:hypothetical protein
MKIYVITQGEYSDYHICAVTDDKERAKKLQLIYSDSYNAAEIEEYNTDDYDDSYVKSYRLAYRVCRFQDGTIKVEGKPEYTRFLNEKDRTPRLILKWWHKKPDGKYEMWRNVFKFMVYADDEAHAIKNAADCFAEWAAMRQNVT